MTTFFENFNQARFEEAVCHNKVDFAQDNHSKSSLSLLCGRHYQIRQAKSKPRQVVQGEVFDVAEDICRRSLTLSQWSLLLSAENKYQLWVPKGGGHSFVEISTQPP